MGGECSIGQRIQSSGLGVGFDLGIPVGCIELGGPRAKPRQFARAQRLDILFDLFELGHFAPLPFASNLAQGNARHKCSGNCHVVLSQGDRPDWNHLPLLMAIQERQTNLFLRNSVYKNVF
jgi:hypothetical protein